jgi:hypothetical protein
MSEEQAQATWVFAMLTATRKRLRLSPKAFAPLVSRHDVIGYLFANHDLLHFYDTTCVVDDILGHMAARDGTQDAIPAAG